MIPALLLLACGAPPQRTLTVLAAASLSDAFTELEGRFEERHPGVDVVIASAGSQTLSTQIRYGIRADVFASADAEHAEALAREGLLEPPRRFAGNRLALLVADQVPGPVDLEGLTRLERLVLGGEEVPLGRYTRELLDAAELRYGAAWREAVEARVVSRELSARLVAAKVAMGEADAAIVYATEAGDALPLPAALSPETACYQAPLTGAPEPELARAWIDLVASGEGQELLAARGFSTETPRL